MKNIDYKIAKLLPFHQVEIDLLQSLIFDYSIEYSISLTQVDCFFLGALSAGLLKDNIRLLKLRIQEKDIPTSYEKLMSDDILQSNKFIHLFEELPYISEYLINSYNEYIKKLSIEDRCEYMNNLLYSTPYFNMSKEDIEESIEAINRIKIPKNQEYGTDRATI